MNILRFISKVQSNLISNGNEQEQNIVKMVVWNVCSVVITATQHRPR